MSKLVALTIIVVGVLSACSKEIPMYRVVVGEKTPLFEVDSPRSLKLASGVTFQVVNGSTGNCGIILMRDNHAAGYMQCGCVGAQTGNCVTENDNPEHPNPSCKGNCWDSEGNIHECDMFGPLPGPPRDPAIVVLRETIVASR
jgi:hypothetical protein